MDIYLIWTLLYLSQDFLAPYTNPTPCRFRLLEWLSERFTRLYGLSHPGPALPVGASGRCRRGDLAACLGHAARQPERHAEPRSLARVGEYLPKGSRPPVPAQNKTGENGHNISEHVLSDFSIYAWHPRKL